MTHEQKRQVKDALVRYVNRFDTQQQAADSLEGISATTISQIKNNNWELLSERLWHHVARQVGFYSGEWRPADTSAYLLLRILLSDAQHYCMPYGIAMGKGLGKTFTACQYTREHGDTFLINGNAQYNRRSFLSALLTTAGVAAKGSVPQMMEQFVTAIADKEEPLLIIDDAHLLKDRVLHLLVLLANSVAGKAGIIVMGAEELRSRIIDGVRLKKVGFDEIYKSIGRRFITLGSMGPRDVELVCRANGVYDEETIRAIKHESENLHTATMLIQQTGEIRLAA